MQMSDGADAHAAVTDVPVVDSGVAALPSATTSQPAAVTDVSASEGNPEIPNPVPAPVPPPIDAATAQPQSTIKSYIQVALQKIQFNKRAKLDKIVALAQKRGRITNDHVELSLHVSDSTAQRYLMQLVHEGRLKRSGTTTNIVYDPI